MNTKDRSYRFYSDAGHGWLAVKREILRNLGVLDKVSPYSYQKGATVYLEEDSDAELFIKAFRETYECNPTIIEKSVNYSPIRSYDLFTKEVPSS